MRVAYFIDSLAPGGAERSLVDLLPELGRLGVIVDIVTLRDEAGLVAEAESAGSRVLCLAGAGGTFGALLRADACVRSLRPDVVHTTHFESDVVGRLAASSVGVPVVTSLVTLDYGKPQLEGGSWTKIRATQALDALTSQLADRFVANAQHVADVMATRLAISTERIVVIPRSRSADKLGKREASRGRAVREELSLAPGQPLVLAVAVHEFAKGLDILVDAMQTVVQHQPDVRLAVAGRDGTQTEALRRQIEDLGLHQHVYLLGPHEDLAGLHCAAEALVLPSRWEAFPSALLEALALETPVVATDVSGVSEVLGQDDIGLLAPAEDAAALGAAIVQTLQERDAAKERAKRGRLRFLSKFTTVQVAKRMKEFYQTVVG